MSQKSAVTRREFIRKFMQAGLTYDQACRVYSTLVSLIEDSVVSGEKIKFGKVGCLLPVRKPPRDVVMGFMRGPGNSMVKSKRVFHLDERVDYRFSFYREFVRKHQLR